MEKKFNTPYDAGYDAGRYGANTINCSFGWFSTKERMQEWQRGNNDGSFEREKDRDHKKLTKK